MCLKTVFVLTKLTTQLFLHFSRGAAVLHIMGNPMACLVETGSVYIPSASMSYQIHLPSGFFSDHFRK